jgi:hypothetical protein
MVQTIGAGSRRATVPKRHDHEHKPHSLSKRARPDRPVVDASGWPVVNPPSVNGIGNAKVWQKDSTKLAEFYLKEHNQNEDREAIYDRDYIASEEFENNCRKSGEELYDAIMADLDRLGLTRTKYQKQFHQAAMHACLYWIYGKEYEHLRKLLMKRLNVKDLDSEVLAIMPRRYGKTVMMAMFAAVMLMRIPGLQIAIFSTGKRASSAMMKMVVAFVKKLGGKDRIAARNEEHLYLSSTSTVQGKVGSKKNGGRDSKDDPTTSHLMSFPANENGKFCESERERVEGV